MVFHRAGILECWRSGMVQMIEGRSITF